MFLHLGQEALIKKNEIIGIFDLDNTTVSRQTRLFLAAKEKEGKIINVATDLPKSFILYRKGDDVVVYISQISAQTLLKRCSFLRKISYL